MKRIKFLHIILHLLIHHVSKAQNALNVSEVAAFVFLIHPSQHREDHAHGLASQPPVHDNHDLNFAIKTLALIPS
jgi:hypothetical protein